MNLVARRIVMLIGVLSLSACRPDSVRDQTKTSTVSTNVPAATHAHTNRLAREKSPYLLQQAHNPVDWFAWNEEAFAKAGCKDKLKIDVAEGVPHRVSDEVHKAAVEFMVKALK